MRIWPRPTRATRLEDDPATASTEAPAGASLAAPARGVAPESAGDRAGFRVARPTVAEALALALAPRPSRRRT